MIKKTGYLVLFFLLYFISGYYKNGGVPVSDWSHVAIESEARNCSSIVYSFPDPAEESLLQYQASLFDFSFLPRLKNNTSITLLSGPLLLTLNKLLWKDGFLCQSSPKRPYFLHCLTGNPHPGAPKAYFVYALRRLII